MTTTTQDNRAATPPTTPRCSSLLVPTMDDAAACARRRRLCGRAEACIRAWERGDERACRALPVVPQTHHPLPWSRFRASMTECTVGAHRHHHPFCLFARLDDACRLVVPRCGLDVVGPDAIWLARKAVLGAAADGADATQEAGGSSSEEQESPPRSRSEPISAEPHARTFESDADGSSCLATVYFRDGGIAQHFCAFDADSGKLVRYERNRLFARSTPKRRGDEGRSSSRRRVACR